MNPGLNTLQPYPFEKLARLLEDARPPVDLAPINLSIGEPKHPTPALITDVLAHHLSEAARYPTTRGLPELRSAICDWLLQRFKLTNGSLDPEQHILPVTGTREALFAIAQCVINADDQKPLVLMPNPFYQIYEGAALLAGAEPRYINCSEGNSFLPDIDSVNADDWRHCQLLYLCSPGNPAGAVIPESMYARLFELADEHDFVIAADECYSEIYLDEAQPPLGLLEAAARCCRHDYRRLIVFHSLSKRSNAPGIRSGFVAGDAELITLFLRYRTYHGCSMAPYTQHASIAAWSDEEHVQENRRLYRDKFDTVLAILQPIMNVQRPQGGFYLWPETPLNDTDFARELLARQNVTVLPGSYLSRDTETGNPGANRVRIALVAPLEECVAAAERIRELVETM